MLKKKKSHKHKLDEILLESMRRTMLVQEFVDSSMLLCWQRIEMRNAHNTRILSQLDVIIPEVCVFNWNACSEKKRRGTLTTQGFFLNLILTSQRYELSIGMPAYFQISFPQKCEL